MRLLPILPLALLAGCATPPKPAPAPPPVVVPPAPPPLPTAGLDRVMGKTAAALVDLFGEPDQDVREGTARRLQFASAVCVLDAYLYPPAGGGPPTVTWLDARSPAGDDLDRASCIAALSRRWEAR